MQVIQVMSRISFTIFVFLLTALTGVCQEKNRFELNGHINVDTGVMILLPVAAPGFYDHHAIESVMPVKNGKFRFQGMIDYPVAGILGLKTNGRWQYISDLFLIEPGSQDVSCNVDSLRLLPAVKNRYSNELSDFNRKLKGSPSGGLSFLQAYILSHPDSYVAAWSLARFSESGYTNLLDSCYEGFSEQFQTSAFGKAIRSQIDLLKLTAVGGTFPALRLATTKNDNELLQGNKRNANFILVDFWFSACVPCAKQFPAFIDLYKKYHDKGFDIIGISTDGADLIGEWKEMIRKHNLVWPQFRDDNGVVAKQLGIVSFPSNFLLDKEGKIIARDISTDDLVKFLDMKLK